jgi:hypothetical protein
MFLKSPNSWPTSFKTWRRLQHQGKSPLSLKRKSD